MTNQEIIDKGREVWSSWSEWKKDIEHKDSYSFTKKECKIIRKEDFKCSNCGKNIFELNDFPVIRDDMVFCEECYSDEYDEICSLCEEIEERKDNEEEQPFPKNPFFYSVKDDEEHIPGIYEAIKYPIWSSNGFSTDIWWDNVKFVCSKEDYLKQYPDRKDNFENAEYICNDCYNIAKEIRDKKNITMPKILIQYWTHYKNGKTIKKVKLDQIIDMSEKTTFKEEIAKANNVLVNEIFLTIKELEKT